MALSLGQSVLGAYLGGLNVLYRPRFRPGMGDPAVLQVHRALLRGRFEEVERAVAAQTNAEDRQFLIAEAAEAPRYQKWSQAYIKAHNRSSIAHSIAAFGAIRLAWKARGTGWARTVTADGWRGFEQHMGIAHELLKEAIRLEPRDAAPWVGMLICQTASSLQVGDPAELFRQATKRSPHLVGAHIVYLSALTPKWGGNIEQFRDFHWRAVAGAPSGHPLHVLACRASIEEMIDTQRSGGASIHPWEFLAQPHIVQRVKTAYMNYFLSPTYIHVRAARHYRAYFAMLFAVAGERELAREQFRHIGSDASDLPWGFLFGPKVKRGMRIARAWSGRYIG